MTARRHIRAIVSFAIILLILSSVPVLAGHTSYKIRRGDTLWDLASKCHTTPKAIAKLNGINENAVLPLGKTVRIPAKQSSTKKTSPRVKHANLGARMHTSIDNVCLRSGAGTSCRKIAVLRKGSMGKVLAQKGNWTKMAFGDGTCGYVYSKLLALGPGAVAFSETSPVSKFGSAAAKDDSGLVETALACRGLRYRRGGTSRGGFDCSGFTRYVFAKYGVALPHSSAAQARLGTPVEKKNLQPGDLVFFRTYRRGISHVGIYTRDGNFVHAARQGRGVRVDTLNSGYYSSRYRGARRVR